MSERDYLLAISAPVRPLHAIAIEVCQKHRVSALDLLSHRRHKSITHARFEFCYRARNESSASFPEIGRFLKRDHTTIMHAVSRHEQIIQQEASNGTS